MAPLTAAQMAKMNPTQIAAYNRQAGITTAKPPATPVSTTPQVIPKPVVKPPATPVSGSQPVLPPTSPFNPLAPPTVQPPKPVATPTTGGSASVITGKPPATGGNAPVQQGTPPMTTPFPATPTPTTPVQAYPAGMDAGSIVQDFTNGLLDEEGLYIQNARRRGVESAQTRGLRNSSIASGASQRAAVEAAQPFVQQMVGIQQDRENRAFTGEQNQLDRNQQITMSQVTNWLNNETFNREFNGALSMLPITSAANLMQTIQEYALDNPEVYTPDVINGFANFFQNNFATMLQDYFPQYYGSN